MLNKNLGITAGCKTADSYGINQANNA